jgi:hypothetical protein
VDDQNLDPVAFAARIVPQDELDLGVRAKIDTDGAPRRRRPERRESMDADGREIEPTDPGRWSEGSRGIPLDFR